MYPSSVGTSFVIQQMTSGSGQFTGADFGRARVNMTHGDADSDVRVAARLYGPLGNSYSVEFIDRGAGVVVSVTTVELQGTAVRVTLRRGSGGSPLARGVEVAAAINAVENLPVKAVAGGTGFGLVTALPPTSLVGGVAAWGTPTGSVWSSVVTYALHADVVFQGVLYRSLQGTNLNHSPDTSTSWWVPMERSDPGTFVWKPTNTDLGLFHPEQEDTVVLRQLEARFTISSGPHSFALMRAPMNAAFEPVVAEAVGVFRYDTLTTSANDIAVSDVRIMLPRGWCFYVLTDVALAGLVRMDLRREANFPYL